MSYYSNTTNIRCFAHSLQLCVNHAMKEPNIQEITKKVRKIVCYFKHSTTAIALLGKQQTLLDLPSHCPIQDEPTRWNSTLYMLQRFDEQKRALFDVIIDQNNFKLIKDVNNDDLVLITEFIKILIPFEEATKMISSEKHPTVSLILPIIKQLQNYLNKYEKSNSTVINSFIEKLMLEVNNMKVKYQEAIYTLKLASFVDLRFKNCKFLDTDEYQMLKESVQSYIMDQNSTTEYKSEIKNKVTNLLWDDYENESSQHDELERYEKISQFRLTDDPFIFWKNNKYEFPNLFRLALRYLCIPGSSVPSERVFSVSGFIVDDLRNRLSPKNVEMLVYLKFNKFLLDYVSIFTHIKINY